MPPPVLGLVVLAALVGAVEAEAGWERQRMNLQEEGKGFVGLCAVAPDFAVAAGVIKQGSSDLPAVFVSRDGTTWQAASPVTAGGPMDFHLYLSCHFRDRRHGYVGGLGEIWVTDDGASSWTRVGLGGPFGGKALVSIAAAGRAGPAFAASSNGELLRSDDDGASWPVVGQPLGEVGLTRVAFADELHGLLASGEAVRDEETDEVLSYHGGGLARTVDGGASWEVLRSGEARQVTGLQLLDRSRGYMVSRSMAGSVLEATDDGGASWRLIETPTGSAAGAVTGLAEVRFFDRCEGWLAGSAGDNDAGVLWKTRDGGRSWLEQEDRAFLTLGKVLGFPIEAKLMAFDFVDRSVGWASGSYETIFRYDADEGPPDCEDGSGPDGGPDDGGGSRCECRAVGAPGRAPLVPLTVAAVVAATWLARRRWRS